MGKTHPKTMQHAHFIGFVGLGNARQTCLMLVLQCRSYQHWYLQPQTLPTACILSVLLGFLRASYRNIISTIGTPFWAAFGSTRETGSSKPKKNFVHFSQSGVSAGLGWAWLSVDSWVGKEGSGQAGTCRQALN